MMNRNVPGGTFQAETNNRKLGPLRSGEVGGEVQGRVGAIVEDVISAVDKLNEAWFSPWLCSWGVKHHP